MCRWIVRAWRLIAPAGVMIGAVVAAVAGATISTAATISTVVAAAITAAAVTPITTAAVATIRKGLGNVWYASGSELQRQGRDGQYRSSDHQSLEGRWGMSAAG
jgi:hypothetical protein